MIKNYLKIAVRNLLKQKGLALINVLGLSIGLACFSLFLLHAVNEYSYDRFHPHADRLYQAARWSETMNGQEPKGDTRVPLPLGPALKADFPDVELVVRFRQGWDDLMRIGDRVQRQDLCFADPQVFEMFNFPLRYGQPETALKDLNSLVLTEKTALQVFGEANPLGRSLEIKINETFVPFTVTGVARDLPANSSIQFALLGNFQFWENLPANAEKRNNWDIQAYQTYVRLREGSNLAQDAERLQAFRKKYYPGEAERLLASGQWDGKGVPIRFCLQPLLGLHTDLAFTGGFTPPVNTKKVWLKLLIAAGVLLIACINFTTLAIGRSAGRAREIGVRKVVGSSRKQLIGQFLAESLLLAAISGGLGLVLAQALLPVFTANLTRHKLTFSLAQYPEIGALMAAVVLVCGLLAGSYPALALSGFRPAEVLKSKIRLGGANWFTKSLVSVQFVLSIGLIISTFVIVRQIRFMQSQYPGFNKENVVVVNAEGVDTQTLYPLFQQSVSAQPGVAGVAGADIGFGAGMGWSTSSWVYKGQHKDVYEYFVEPHFLDVMAIPLVSGRNFDPAVGADARNSVVVNEAFVRNFGWTPQTALGQPLLGYSDEPGAVQPVVIGVVRDFNFRPLTDAIEPQMFHRFSDYQLNRFMVRLKPGDPASALSAIEKTWKGLAPEVPFQYSFLDEDLDRFYGTEQRWSIILGWTGGISIFLACLGLFGLAALAAVNRTKEIGIRRVLGASVVGITGLLSRDFIKLVVLAFALATPLAWYCMHRWLENFSYHIQLEWWLFALAGLGALLLAFLTVSVQSIRASLANPINSLRNE